MASAVWGDQARAGDELARDVLWVLRALQVAARKGEHESLAAPTSWARRYLEHQPPGSKVFFVSPPMSGTPTEAGRTFLAFCDDELEALGADRDGRLSRHLKEGGAWSIAWNASGYFRDLLVASGVELPSMSEQRAGDAAHARLVRKVAGRKKIDARAIASACLRAWGMSKSAADNLLLSAGRDKRGE